LVKLSLLPNNLKFYLNFQQPDVIHQQRILLLLMHKLIQSFFFLSQHCLYNSFIVQSDYANEKEIPNNSLSKRQNLQKSFHNTKQSFQTNKQKQKKEKRKTNQQTSTPTLFKKNNNKLQLEQDQFINETNQVNY